MTESPKIETWWEELNNEVRASLAADPGKVLTGEEVVEITRVRLVGPTGSQWEGQPGGYSFHLSEEDQDWIRDN